MPTRRSFLASNLTLKATFAGTVRDIGSRVELFAKSMLVEQEKGTP